MVLTGTTEVLLLSVLELRAPRAVLLMVFRAMPLILEGATAWKAAAIGVADRFAEKGNGNLQPFLRTVAASILRFH